MSFVNLCWQVANKNMNAKKNYLNFCTKIVLFFNSLFIIYVLKCLRQGHS